MEVSNKVRVLRTARVFCLNRLASFEDRSNIVLKRRASFEDRRKCQTKRVLRTA